MSAPTKAQLVVLETMAARFIGSDKAGKVLPFFIGAWIDSLLMGLAIAQMFQYRRYIRMDKLHIVLLVCFAFASTLAATILSSLWMTSLFVMNLATYLPFTGTQWLCRHLAADIICSFLVQVFYVDRLNRLWKSYWPTMLIGPFVLATSVMGGVVIYAYNVEDYITPSSTHIAVVERLTYTLFSCVLATDFLITVTLSYGLWRQRTGWKQTDSMLRRMIYRCCETQTFALLSAIFILIAWNRKFQIAVCCLLFQSKMYYLGLQLTLNLRPGSSESSVNISYPSVPTAAKISAASQTQSHIASSHDVDAGGSTEKLAPPEIQLPRMSVIMSGGGMGHGGDGSKRMEDGWEKYVSATVGSRRSSRMAV